MAFVVKLANVDGRDIQTIHLLSQLVKDHFIIYMYALPILIGCSIGEVSMT